MNLSKLLHVATMACFLLPFFYTGCDSEERKTSVAVVKPDTATVVSAKIVSEFFSKNDSASQKMESSETASQKIIKKFPFLKPVLLPGKDNVSGIGTVVDCIPFVPFFSVLVSFLFLFLGFVVKYMDAKAEGFIHTFNIIALFFLAIGQAPTIDSDPLWGYWVAIFFGTLLTMNDWFFSRRKNYVKLQSSLTSGSNGE